MKNCFGSKRNGSVANQKKSPLAQEPQFKHKEEKREKKQKRYRLQTPKFVDWDKNNSIQNDSKRIIRTDASK